jgi:hypothetical protein
MNTQKTLIAFIGLLLISAGLAGAYTSISGIKLPDTPVTLNVVDGTASYWVTTLSNVPSGFDVTNGQYLGWCVDTSITMVRGTDHTVTLYDSYDPALPAPFHNPNWDKANWILNNENSFTISAIQSAIWYVLGEVPWDQMGTGAHTLVASANVSGVGFHPQAGQVIAIVAVPGSNENDCQGSIICIPLPEVCCRWTGGGTIGTDRNPRVTHGFELHCDVTHTPNNLEVNWGGNHFHLTTLTQATCSDDPTISPNPPNAPCDTIHGFGIGRVNGVSGYHIEFIFTDAGEPGTHDFASITITSTSGALVLHVEGFLSHGNQQAHRCTGR